MDSGYYAASAGLRAQSQALEVAAHNLSNINTPGFRGQQMTFESLLAVGRPAVSNPLTLVTNNYGVLEGTHLDLSEGNLASTGNPLDVAIQGSGFFAVQTARGTRYTRNGGFQISSAGELVTSSGDPVLGATGTIRIPAGTVAIAADGTVSVNGTVAGQIKIVDFPPRTKLVSETGTLLAAPQGAVAQAPAETSLRQGMIESSNVNAIASVVGLIAVQRAAEMMGRAMSLFDTEFNHIAASELAKV